MNAAISRIWSRSVRLSLVWVVVFLLLHSLLVHLRKEWMSSKETAYFDIQMDFVQGNFARSQKLLYENLDGQDLFLGSSLTYKLQRELLVPPFQRFDFIGDGPITGLRILSCASSKPRRVYIESNYVVTRGMNEKTLEALFSRPMGDLRRLVPAFRPSYKPANFLVMNLFPPSWGFFVPNEQSEARRREVYQAPIAPDDTKIDVPAMQKNALDLRQEFSGSFWRVDGLLAELTQAVRALESRGVECVFYRMPMSAEAEGYDYYQKVQRMLEERFPPARYRWVKPSDAYHYITFDGFHLTDKSGQAYTRHLVEQSQCANPAGRPN